MIGASTVICGLKLWRSRSSPISPALAARIASSSID
jgi:hypothetical protein